MNTETKQVERKRDISEYPKFLFKIENIQYPERFNSAQFGPYEDPDTGKTVFLINPDGRAVESGFLTSRMNLLFYTHKIADAERVRFLLKHPDNIANGGERFSLTDVDKASENKDDNLIKELELETKIMSLDLRKLKAVASALMLNYQGNKKSLQASVVRRVRTEQQAGGGKTEPGYISVERVVNSKKTMILLDIRQMLDYGLISINNSGIYVHGQHNLGLDPEQVAFFFEKEQALYGLLKTELRKKLSADGKLDDGKDNLELNL